jgi:hypothetical protein
MIIPDLKEYRKSFAESFKPTCEICGVLAFGDYLDEDWNKHPICLTCFNQKFNTK